MKKSTMDNLEKLSLLLEQEQCEFIEVPDGFTGRTRDGRLRLIYLMNDAVESFLILENARMTGNYKKDYEGEVQTSLERQLDTYVLAVHQGESVFTVFFDEVLLEEHFYDYGSIGHFWVKKYENLRVLEYQIAILRDKYDYLGDDSCTEEEKQLAMLKDFPPLTYLFYPAVSEKYVVPTDQPWHVTKEAIEVMRQIAQKVQDERFLSALQKYQADPSPRMAKRIAGMLHRKKHAKVVQLLSESIRNAAAVYPDRDFGKEKNEYIKKLLQKAQQQKAKLNEQGIYAVIYKEEPFVYDCDSISFQVCLMTQRNGVWDQKISLEFFR